MTEPASPANEGTVERSSPVLPGEQPRDARGEEEALSGAGSKLLVVLFATAIFLNAALLFAVQPMFTKMVLPLMGGSPTVWNTCLLFFQTALLGGYLYAHATTRVMSLKAQAGLHIALLLVALAILPIHIPAALATPSGSVLPIPWLLGVLAVSLGLPFLLLAAGAPMMQRWFAATRHRSAKNPYFLYAASNLGSFVALLAYPFVIEPRMGLSDQSVTWLEFYYALLGLIALCAIAVHFVRRRADHAENLAEVAGEGDAMAAAAAATASEKGLSRLTEQHVDVQFAEFDDTATPARAHGGAVGESDFTSFPADEAAGFGHESAQQDPATEGPPPSTAAASLTPQREAGRVKRPGAFRGSVRRLVSENPAAETLVPPPQAVGVNPTLIPDRHWRLRWVLLAFAPSSLLIGVTTYLSTDIAAVPFMWVIPLAIYLLTFVLVFARRPLFGRSVMLHAQLVLGLVLMIAICIGPGRRITTTAALHLAAFFATAMVCHRELADSRPRADYLTEFYLWMAFGGVLGGAFNVLFAPTLYTSLVEYPFALIIAFGLRPGVSRTYGGWRAFLLDVSLPALVGFAIWAALRWPSGPRSWGGYGTQTLLGAAAIAVAFFWKRPLRLALGAGAIYAATQVSDAMDSSIIVERRSFFGIYRVRQILEYKVLQHGTTTHGGQSTRPERRLEPLTYYYKEGPLGQIFATVAADRPMRNVAIVGLGTGATACYGRPDERWTYYEIDPLVQRIARTPQLFTYLRDCPPKLDIVLGDARLSLARAPDASYDLIILDAFSSDAIPAHLLTREALALYLRKLRDEGAVAFHISNRYLDLRPVLIAAATEARIPGVLGEKTIGTEDRVRLHYGSRWIVMAKKPSTLAGLVKLDEWDPLPSSPAGRVWTDDYSDVLSVMKWR